MAKDQKAQAQQEAYEARRQKYLAERKLYTKGRNRAFLIAIAVVAVLLIIAVLSGL